MMAAILILFVLPFGVHSDIKRFEFTYVRLVAFWFFLNISILLGWIGGNVAEGVYIIVGQGLTLLYFAYFLFLIVLSNLYNFTT